MLVKHTKVGQWIAFAGMGLAAVLLSAGVPSVEAARLKPPPVVTSSNIEGVVLGAFSGTLVTAHNNSTGAMFTTFTNGESFFFGNLPAGNYTLSSLGGFAGYTVPNPYPYLVLISPPPALRAEWMD